jgi:hypothetical protein
MATNSYGEQDHPFRVGGLYANRIGEYEVIEIATPKMTVRYHDGGTLVADIAILARIWENMQAPAPGPEPRARAASRSSAARGTSASTAAPKPAAAPRAPRVRREPKE